eukprot:1187680-Prorocentrum_minimum.AAC.1
MPQAYGRLDLIDNSPPAAGGVGRNQRGVGPGVPAAAHHGAGVQAHLRHLPHPAHGLAPAHRGRCANGTLARTSTVLLLQHQPRCCNVNRAATAA